MKRPKVNTAYTDDFTDDDWRELRLTGLIIKGNRIIRTMSFIKRVQDGSRKEIQQIASRLFK